MGEERRNKPLTGIEPATLCSDSFLMIIHLTICAPIAQFW